ncbi:MAG: exosortase/archaeosortase family protein [Gemmatimonadota bacterium]
MTEERSPAIDRSLWLPLRAAILVFAMLYAKPAYLLVRDWTNFDNPDSGTGLLLAPLAFYFAFQTGLKEVRRPAIGLAIAFLLAAIGIRFVSDLAAELFTMRVSMLIGAAGLILWFFGVRQLLAFWLPFVLLGLAIPLPELVIAKLTAPLQLVASRIGASLIEWRNIPVLLNGNVIRIPGHDLFVAEACSGLRSLTALVNLGVLLGAMLLAKPWSRVTLLVLAVPMAILINGFRIFLTAFLVYFVSPEAGSGFMHTTEGWLMFVIAFASLGAVASLLLFIEGKMASRGRVSSPVVAPAAA